MSEMAQATVEKRQPFMPASGLLQRRCDKCIGLKSLEHKSSRLIKPEVLSSIVSEASQLSGQPLGTDTQEFMKPKFGHDLSKVRIHSDAKADIYNRKLNSHAFTIGNDIFFKRGNYDPLSSSGRELLAHELTHTVQQTNSDLHQCRIGHCHDKYEREADLIAREITSNEPKFIREKPNDVDIQLKEDEASLDTTDNKIDVPADTRAPPPKTDASPNSTMEGNPLVGLTREDGIKWGTWERRPRVKLLQEKLNEKMMAALVIDGMFGPKVEKALNEFQISINAEQQNTVDKITADALLDKNEPPSKKKEPDENTTVNPRLEDTMDAMWLQYQSIYHWRSLAVDKLERDLSVLENPSNIINDFAKFLLSKFLDNTFFDKDNEFSVHGLIRGGIDQTGMQPENKSSVKTWVIGPLFDDDVKNSANGKLNEILDSGSQDNKISPSVFIESLRYSILESSDKDQEKFLLNVKNVIRTFPWQPEPSEVTDDTEDNRLRIARTTLNVLQNKKLESFEKTYDDSVKAWSRAMAQSRLGGSQGVTNMSTDIEGVSGVLELSIQGTTPDKEVTIEEAKIAGLSKVIRDRLTKDKRGIGTLGFPRLAKGSVEEPPNGGQVTITKDEAGNVFENSDEGGKNWLREKSVIEIQKTPVILGPPTPKRGAEIVFDEEIDPKNLSQIKDGLKGPQ